MLPKSPERRLSCCTNKRAKVCAKVCGITLNIRKKSAPNTLGPCVHRVGHGSTAPCGGLTGMEGVWGPYAVPRDPRCRSGTRPRRVLHRGWAVSRRAKHDVKNFGATAKRKKFVEGQLLGWRLATRAGFGTFEAVSRKFKCVARCVPSVVWNGRKTVREGIFEKGLKTGVFFFLGPRSVCGCYVCGVWKFSIPH